MIVIEGTRGEGGGQILRSALALSLVTGRAFRIDDIRGRRRRPGLLRQHLAAVRAAEEIGRARVQGAHLGSRHVVFTPSTIAAGEYRFDVGSAGSGSLVLQAVLPALLAAGGRSRVEIGGGTHNPWAPPFDFLRRAFLPLIERMGARATATLDRPGFYPEGGGRFTVELDPGRTVAPLQLTERGDVVTVRVVALTAHLPDHVARRELEVVAGRMGRALAAREHRRADHALGAGNAVMVEVECGHVRELFTAFGARGVRAEVVADRAVEAAERYIESGVAVGEHLADQLLLPLALARGGSFTTLPPTPHTMTNIAVIRSFIDVELTISQEGHERWLIRVETPG